MLNAPPRILRSPGTNGRSFVACESRRSSTWRFAQHCINHVRGSLGLAHLDRSSCWPERDAAHVNACDTPLRP